MSMRIFVPLTKVDQAKRLVYGVAAVEELDKSNEIFDYDSSKPNFESWSAEIEKASDGKSLGNVRAMHGKVAAGKLTNIAFDDDQKMIEVVAKIVDDNEWKKVDEGVYTGFSIGGRYAKRWKDGDATRYTAEPSEISIVDNPCQPSARFTMVKADGLSEERPFKEKIMTITNDMVAAEARELAKAAGDETKWASYVETARTDLEKKVAAQDGGKPTPTTETSEGANAPGEAKDKGTEAPSKHGKAGKKKPGDAPEHGDNSEADVDESEVDNKDNAGVSHKADGMDPTKPSADLEQVWKAKDGKTFAKKADAVAHNAELETVDADPAAKLAAALGDLTKSVEQAEAPKPVEKFDGLANVEDGLEKGIYWLEKKDYSEDKRKELADSGKAMKDGSYPIADKADLKNAVQAFGRAKDKPATKKHIIQRAKALDATDLLPEGWEGSTAKKSVASGDLAKALVASLAKHSGRPSNADELKKGLYAVGSLARIIQELEYLQCECEWEAAAEKDGSTLPQEIKEDIANLCNTLKNMVAEETRELFDGDGEMDAYEEMLEAADRPTGLDALAKVLGDKAPARLAKVGARNSKKDQDVIQKMHDHSVELGAMCKSEGGEKAAGGDLAKALAENGRLTKAIETATQTITDLGKRVKALEDQPMPRPAEQVQKTQTFTVVDKGQDDSAGAYAQLQDMAKNDPEKLALMLVKAAQQQPQQMSGTGR